ncbi:hypothetical protein [Priestia koreensis]|uniref:hypothetical protein n=1 Tax=Priestia koreensis TaxID=284581 RepID=UPI001F57FE07|nr:hypothetical protein [Priestia koreensis]MCM3003642.1 hypothetical protein [Priestia koreensis]UNL86457.1 hypothetical protein IE339_08220 [Priestia koreensis]
MLTWLLVLVAVSIVAAILLDRPQKKSSHSLQAARETNTHSKFPHDDDERK